MKRLAYSGSGLFLFLFSLLLMISGCAPIFSEMQDARTVGKDNVDITASFSSVYARDTERGEGNHAQSHAGFQAAYGLSDAVDLRMRYAMLWVDDEREDISVNILGVGPKFRLLENRLAAYLPVGFAFGKDVEDGANTWQVHPTLLGTIPAAEKVDVNPSFKVLIPFERESETLVAFNLGLGIKLSEEFTLRPEYGMLFNPGEKGHFKQFGIGVTMQPAQRADRN